eukprot:g6532.t1
MIKAMAKQYDEERTRTLALLMKSQDFIVSQKEKIALLEESLSAAQKDLANEKKLREEKKDVASESEEMASLKEQLNELSISLSSVKQELEKEKLKFKEHLFQEEEKEKQKKSDFKSNAFQCEEMENDKKEKDDESATLEDGWNSESGMESASDENESFPKKSDFAGKTRKSENSVDDDEDDIKRMNQSKTTDSSLPPFEQEQKYKISEEERMRLNLRPRYGSAHATVQASPCCEDEIDRSTHALYKACFEGNYDQLRSILAPYPEKAHNTNLLSSTLGNALFTAISGVSKAASSDKKSGHIMVMNELLARGACLHPHIQSFDKIELKKIGVEEELISNLKNDTILHYCARFNLYEPLHSILLPAVEKGKRVRKEMKTEMHLEDILLPLTNDGSCFNVSSSSKDVRFLHFELENRLDQKNDEGFRPIEVALQSNSCECIELLMNSGCDFDFTSSSEDIEKLKLEKKKEKVIMYNNVAWGKRAYFNNDLDAAYTHFFKASQYVTENKERRGGISTRIESSILCNCAYVSLQLKHSLHSLRVCKQAIAIDPDFSVAWNIAGQAAFSLFDISLAKEYFSKVVSLVEPKVKEEMRSWAKLVVKAMPLGYNFRSTIGRRLSEDLSSSLSRSWEKIEEASEQCDLSKYEKVLLDAREWLQLVEEKEEESHYVALGMKELVGDDGCLEANSREGTAISKAYRKACRKYHPDKQKGKSPDEQYYATKMFERIQKAYNLLANPELREKYDLELRRKYAQEKRMQALRHSTADVLGSQRKGFGRTSPMNFNRTSRMNFGKTSINLKRRSSSSASTKRESEKPSVSEKHNQNIQTETKPKFEEESRDSSQYPIPTKKRRSPTRQAPAVPKNKNPFFPSSTKPTPTQESAAVFAAAGDAFTKTQAALEKGVKLRDLSSSTIAAAMAKAADWRAEAERLEKMTRKLDATREHFNK